MLAETVQEWTKEWQAQGMQRGLEQGLEQGLQKGRQEEAASMLIRLLKRRYGSLPNWVESKVSNADVDEIEGWVDKIFDAASLDSVFE
uniref:Transposase n=1 Tax=Magnetococcus massalia (strain MO-1) TaxID=451514 RepID=A0A1S7LG23_MAGMO